MNLLKHLAILSVATFLYGEWDPSVLSPDNPSSLTVLHNRHYTNLKAKVLSSLANSWCSSEKAQLLMDLTFLNRPKVCVEIGACTGSSVLPVSAILKHLEHGKMYAIDAWSNGVATRYLADNDPNKAWWASLNMSAVHEKFIKLVKEWSLKRYCKEIYRPSEEAIHHIPSEIDFIHFDGDYSETGSMQDVQLYLPRVKWGGYVLISNLSTVVNGQQPKIKAFSTLCESCEIVAEIDRGNTILFQKTMSASNPFVHPHSDAPYIIGDVLGQLGNQFFEIAAASALAWDHGAQTYFPNLVANSKEYLHIFFRCNRNTPATPPSFSWAQSSCYGYETIPYHPNMKMSGYLQHSRYFAHHRNRLLELFAPHPKDLKYIERKYGALLSHPKTVSVHLRYYYREKPDEETFIQYERDYYEKAMNLFPNDSLFIVISDNVPFAKENIPAENRTVVFIENEPFYIDFYLQTLCKNNIICNSSFSWWGAWLNRNEHNIVVRPKVWLGGQPDMDGPDHWIKVEATSYQEKLRRGS